MIIEKTRAGMSGAELKTRREGVGLLQRTLADALEVDLSTYKMYEAGRIPVPERAEGILKVCERDFAEKLKRLKSIPVFGKGERQGRLLLSRAFWTNEKPSTAATSTAQ